MAGRYRDLLTEIASERGITSSASSSEHHGKNHNPSRSNVSAHDVRHPEYTMYFGTPVIVDGHGKFTMASPRAQQSTDDVSRLTPPKDPQIDREATITSPQSAYATMAHAYSGQQSDRSAYNPPPFGSVNSLDQLLGWNEDITGIDFMNATTPHEYDAYKL